MRARLRRLPGSPVEGVSLRLATALSVRPGLVVGLVLVAVTLSLLMAPTAQAAPADGCGGGVGGMFCKGAHSVGLGGLWDTADKTRKTIEALSPSNFLDTWAQGLCSAVVFVLAFIEAVSEKLGTPAYDQQWWASQYAVSFGLALIVLAFLLLVVTAKIGSAAEGSVSGVELLRQAGVRIIFVFPACMAAPAVLYSLQQVAAQLSKTFADQSVQDGHGAIGAMMNYLKAHAGDWGTFGGTIMVIVMMFFVLLTAIVLLVEVSVANWGLTLSGLLVPFALVAAVYPPWARTLKRLCMLIGTLMFTPVATFFFFWTVWSAFNSFMTSKDSSNSGFSMLLFLLISLIMIDAFPLVSMWLLGLAAPDAEAMDPAVRELAPSPTEGDVYGGMKSMFDRQFSRGGASDGDNAEAGGGADVGGSAGPQDEPEVGDAPKGVGGEGTGGTGDGGSSGGGVPGGGPAGGLGGAGGAEGGAAGGAEIGAAEGAELGAAGGVEGGPAGMAVGAGLGMLAGTAMQAGQKVQAIPDDIHAQSEQMMNDSDGSNR